MEKRKYLSFMLVLLLGLGGYMYYESGSVAGELNPKDNSPTGTEKIILEGKESSEIIDNTQDLSPSDQMDSFTEDLWKNDNNNFSSAERYYYGLVNHIHNLIRTPEYCLIGTPPAENCDWYPQDRRDLKKNCKRAYNSIKSYLRRNAALLKFKFVPMDNGRAYIDAKLQNHTIYINDKYKYEIKFDENTVSLELLRTIAHELYHLSEEETITFHPEVTSRTNNCEYYSHDAFTTEFCLTCKATLVEVLFSSCTVKDSILIIN